MKGEKKISLFKQKLNQGRTNLKEEKNGFPRAPCIVEEIKKSEETIQAHQVEQQQPLQKKGFLQALNCSKVLGQAEASKIQSQNWDMVNKMSEDQRQKAIEQLRAQLPDSFLSAINQKTTFIKQQQKQQPKEESGKETEKEILEQEEQSEQGWRQNLKLNLKQQVLEWTSTRSDNLMDVDKMFLIAGHENNQSKVVGSSLLKLWSRAISSLLTTKTRQLFFIDGNPLHGGIIAQQLAKGMLISIQEARKSNYKSVFLQISTNISEAIIHAQSIISRPSKKLLALKLQQLIPKSKDIGIQLEQAVKIKDSLTLLVSQLQQKQDSFQWLGMLENIDAIIELSLLEGPYNNGYWMKAYQFASKCSDLEQLLELLAFQYEFIHKLIIKRNIQPYLDLKQYRQLWTSSVDVLIHKFTQSCWNIDPQFVFKSIFLARFVGGISWQAMNNTVNLFQEKSLLASGFILFNTFPDLKAETLTQQQVTSLNLALSWLSTFSSKKQISSIDPNYILSTLLELFYQEQQYYSCLNQELLSALLEKIFSHQHIDVDKNVSTQQINTLTKNYNYNSFGNHSFSYLLLGLAWSVSAQKQAIILKQSISPCWKQFFDVASVSKLSQSKMPEKDVNRDLKDEIMENIKNEGKQLNEKNALICLIQ